MAMVSDRENFGVSITTAFQVAPCARFRTIPQLRWLARARRARPKRLAFVIQSIVALVAGSFLTLLTERPIHIASGLDFLVFAFPAFSRKEEKAASEEDAAVKQQRGRHAAWPTSSSSSSRPNGVTSRNSPLPHLSHRLVTHYPSASALPRIVGRNNTRSLLPGAFE